MIHHLISVKIYFYMGFVGISFLNLSFKLEVSRSWQQLFFVNVMTSNLIML